jgi:pyruvate-ferredoxin/flavodoxin oxidoreductase
VSSCRRPVARDVAAQFKDNGDSKVATPPPSAPSPQPPSSTSLAAPKQPGAGKAVLKAIDGNEATANIAYAFNDVSFIYPITPATPMGEAVDAWANEGRVNLHGNVMEVRVRAWRRRE